MAADKSEDELELTFPNAALTIGFPWVLKGLGFSLKLLATTGLVILSEYMKNAL